MLARTAVLQIDSVNVLARAHYLPVFSRVGPYQVDVLDRMAYRAPRELFEYWGHEASLLPVAMQPLFRWRMDKALEDAWRPVKRIESERPGFVKRVLEEVRARGPLTAADLGLTERAKAAGPWWSWPDDKAALEWLFWSGQVTTSTRRGFERVYDIPERVLPERVLRLPTPDRADAQRELVRIAAGALGVATEGDLRDYFRLGVGDGRARVAELVEAGELRPVRVAGWAKPAYLHPQARLPARVEARALLAPFDPLVWERDRTQRLFGMRYRIEIYVPAPKRVHGYYVLPFLLGDRLVARVDLKADRQAGLLRVQGCHLEPDRGESQVAAALADELRSMAGWLGLGGIAVAASGDLAPALRRAV